MKKKYKTSYQFFRVNIYQHHSQDIFEYIILIKFTIYFFSMVSVQIKILKVAHISFLLKRVSREPRRKITANTSGKAFITRIYMELTKLHCKRTNNPIHKLANELTRQSLEEYKWPINARRSVQHPWQVSLLHPDLNVFQTYAQECNCWME